MLNKLTIVSIFVLMLSMTVFAGPKAPNFTLQNLEGEEVSLSDYEGNVLIIDFWATWCPPCKMEIPHFNELFTEYNERGLEVLGISLDRGGMDVVTKFMEDTEINYTVLMGNNSLSNDYQEFVKPDERNAIPFTFVVDREGNIAEVMVGYKPKADFEKAIVKLLGE